MGDNDTFWGMMCALICLLFIGGIVSGLWAVYQGCPECTPPVQIEDKP